MDEVHSDVIEVHVNECAYDKMSFNITTFTVDTADNFAPLACTVRYIAVGNSSVVYYEEQFVVFDGSTKPLTNKDISQKENKPNKNSGKYIK